jgi:uncharacterized protein YwgA
MSEVGKLIAFLKELGFKPNLDDFEDKLVIQKTVCLLELMGAELNYEFSLYVRGPYSPSLTKELYDNKEAVENLETSVFLDEAEKKCVEKIRVASNGLKPVLLEVMATYLFLVRKLCRSSKEAIAELKGLKPFFSEADVAVGVSKSKTLFPPTQKEVEDMKNEFRAWEAASDADVLSRE